MAFWDYDPREPFDETELEHDDERFDQEEDEPPEDFTPDDDDLPF